jgi:hypothetical protein
MKKIFCTIACGVTGPKRLIQSRDGTVGMVSFPVNKKPHTNREFILFKLSQKEAFNFELLRQKAHKQVDLIFDSFNFSQNSDSISEEIDDHFSARSVKTKKILLNPHRKQEN